MFNYKTYILVCIATLLIVCVQTTAQTPQDLIAIQHDIAQALDAHDIDRVLSHLQDDVVYDFAVMPVPFNGKEQIRAFFEGEFNAFPDWHVTEGLVLAAGNVLVVEHAAAGTHLGVWNGIPPTGNMQQLPHIDVYEFAGDKVKKATTYADMAGVLMQLGAMPIPQMAEWVPSFTLPDPEPTGLSRIEAAKEGQARWNAHDLAEYAKMLHPEDDVFFASVGVPLNREAYMALQELYFLAFPDAQVHPIRFVDLGDGWVLCECTWTGTHMGPYFGIPPGGAPVELRGVILYHYDEQGMERAIHCYFDNLTLTAQITPQLPEAPPIPDYLVQDEITSQSLEGNLLGDPATRPLLVYLPPSYETSPEKHYPTIYLLHGFLNDHTSFTAAGGYNLALKTLTGIDPGIDVGGIVPELMAAGHMDEAIIVMPNASNALGGSMYGRSSLIGDYRTYIAEELVSYIDQKYRTIVDRRSRGITGHSMGGYGALSLAMEYSNVFGAVAALGPGGYNMDVTPSFVDKFVTKYPLVSGLPMFVSTPEEIWNVYLSSFEANVVYAFAAAWTPNLDNPPFFVDLPVQYPEKAIVPDVLEKWLEHSLASQIALNGGNLANTAVFVGEGRGPAMIMEEPPGVDRILEALYAQGISHTYEALPGDHMTHVRKQLAAALKFLNAHIGSPETP